MIAQTYLNGFIQIARDSNDPALMLSLQNLCFDNIQKFFLTKSENQKATDQLNNINDIWFTISIIAAVMQDLKTKIDNVLFLKDAVERKEILDKISEDAQIRLSEINKQYDEYIANQIIIQQQLNQVNINNLLKQRVNIANDLGQLTGEIAKLRVDLQSVNQAILLDFNKMIFDTSIGSSYKFFIAEKGFSVSQEEIDSEMKKEFGEDLKKEIINLSNFESRVLQGFQNINNRKISEGGLNPFEHEEQSKFLAKNSADKWITKFKAHENFVKLEENIEKRDLLKSELISKIE
jgi:hypothetical protein